MSCTILTVTVLASFLLVSTGSAAEHCSAKAGDNSRTCTTDSATQDSNLHFKALKGLFVQEEKHAALSEPGQHPDFGAKKPWPKIIGKLKPGRKLVHLIRHGEAVSNAVQAYVGDKTWDASVAAQCTFHNKSSGEQLQLYDPSLTARGQSQVAALHKLLREGNVSVSDLTGGKPFKVVVSPLSRTLDTFLGVLGDLVSADAVSVDEFCRERYGHNTCDARRPVNLSDKAPASSPKQDSEGMPPALTSTAETLGTGEAIPILPGDAAGDAEPATRTARELLGHHKGPHKAQQPPKGSGNRQEGSWSKSAHKGHKIDCPVDIALAEKYPNISFRVLKEEGDGLGLVSNADVWWDSEHRENKKHLVRRLRQFLERIFRDVTEEVVFVVTHSGAITAILEAVGREAYSAANAELVPMLVEVKN